MKAIAGAAVAQICSAKATTALYYYVNTDYETPVTRTIAHQGASGSFPQDSIGSFAEAFYAGADFLSMSVQITKDKELVILEDSYLNETTDIAEQTRWSYMKRDDGMWYVEDFTLAQLKVLRLK